jgi:hypothetical protein
MEVLLSAVLINALHPALEDREIALNRVRMNVATAPLIDAVVHSAMLGKLLAQTDIEPKEKEKA